MKHMARWFCKLLVLCILPLAFSTLFLSGCVHYRYAPNQIRTTELYPHYIKTNEGQIEYYQFGRGSPIVLIPGYATDVSSWDREFLAGLSQHHLLILPNNRNVGGSNMHSTVYQMHDLANDTYQLILQLHLKKPTVVGISMGGMIAQELVILHPQAISHLVLINTMMPGTNAAPPTPDIQQKLLNLSTNKLGFYYTAVNNFFPTQWKMRMAYALVANRFQTLQLHSINAAVVIPQQQRVIRHWVKDNLSATHLSQLNLPVLILNGQADIIIPPINSVILANQFPNATLMRWKDGGHAMIYQYPVEMSHVINTFLSQNRSYHEIHQTSFHAR